MARTYTRPPPLPLRVRFERHVDRNGPVPPHKPELGPCWLWTASRLKDRQYGMLTDQGKGLLAHRVAFFLEHGRWPLPCCRTPRSLQPGRSW